MIGIILFAIAGILNAIMDRVAYLSTYERSIFNKYQKLEQFCSAEKSWKNKWKNGDKSQGEKFLGSSTIFVTFTDLWHLCKSLMIFCIIFSLFFYKQLFESDLITLFIYYICFTGAFELFYNYILYRKN